MFPACEMFPKGEWSGLTKRGALCATQEDDATDREIQVCHNEFSRVEALVQMGELSSARQVLQGASLAPGTEATLVALSRAPDVFLSSEQKFSGQRNVERRQVRQG